MSHIVVGPSQAGYAIHGQMARLPQDITLTINTDKTITVHPLRGGVSVVGTVGAAAAVSVSELVVTLTAKNDGSTTVAAMQALIAASPAAQLLSITGTGTDTFSGSWSVAETPCWYLGAILPACPIILDADGNPLSPGMRQEIALLHVETLSVTDAITWSRWIDVAAWAHISWTVRNDGPNPVSTLYWRMALDTQGTGVTGYQSTGFSLSASSARSWYDTLPPGTSITPSTGRQPLMAPALQLGFQCLATHTASVDLRVYGTQYR